ncbi:hypothetical protein C6497_14440 [Candidatus Poribacteria bacterium]|nr:MAG: hypothetical protein C6497_14440 [Candidatus Poribacteria bacterium]
MTIQYFQINLKNKNSITYTISEKNSCIDGFCGCHLIGYTLKGYVPMMRYYHLENVLKCLYQIVTKIKEIKKKKDTKSLNIRISILLKKHR